MKRQIIGPIDNPYMTRWFVIPKNRRLNIYIHKFHRSDDDRAMHDHPWWSIGIILKGGYWDVTPRGRQWLFPGFVKFRRAETIHRVELHDNRPSWSLFITGPNERSWGFWCPQGWRHWREFTRPSQQGGDSGEIGRGCDD